MLVVASVVLGALMATVVVVPRFLPFYDLDEWVLQGQIVHDLIVGADSLGTPVADLYGWLPAPVPNLVAPLGIGTLALVLPITVATRVFLVIGLVGFSAGYAFLVRRLQNRPTIAELAGPLVAFGYFLQRGYVSYLFALPLAFVGIAVIHPVLLGPVTRARMARIALLGVAAFLAHLVAWGVLAVALLGYAAVLWRRRRRRDATGLVSTLVPAVLLLVWYVAVKPGSRHLALYASLRDKGLALVETVHLFLRLDPYPGAVPTFLAQLLVGAAAAGMLAVNLRARDVRPALGTPAVGAALALATVAVLDPVGNVDSLTKPDQRLLFPALLILVAGLPWREPSPRRVAAAGTVVGASLLLHAATLLTVQAPLGAVADAIDRTVPAGAAVTTVAVPADGGCRPTVDPGPTIGIPSLKWFDVGHQLRRGQVRAALQETSGVTLRFDPRSAGTLTTLTPAAAQAAAAVRSAGPAPVVEVFACPADLARVTADLRPTYAVVASGTGFAVLSRG